MLLLEALTGTYLETSPITGLIRCGACKQIENDTVQVNWGLISIVPLWCIASCTREIEFCAESTKILQIEFYMIPR